jgi:hypothetical protein
MNLSRLRPYIMTLIGLALLWGIWQFRPPPPPLELPTGIVLDKAVWLGIEWGMTPHSNTEVVELAQNLQKHNITYVFAYVSYLKPGDIFNPTFDHAAEFVQQFRAVAPQIRLLAWVGVPIQIITPDGEYLDNRLVDAATHQTIAGFSQKMVTEFGFDGVHLNAEAITSGDEAILATLDAIRKKLTSDALLSLAVHALRLTESVTTIPYPAIRHHWSPDYLRRVAEHTDQLVLMAYDSGLFFPSDYREWLAYQVRQSAEALAGIDTHFLIGLPASEEWTPSHQVPAEYLANALYGLSVGLNQTDYPHIIDGIAIYPHWEISDDEWALLDEFSS